jgi:hypothetical protein
MKLEIDIFRGRNKGMIILEVEHPRVGDKATLTDLPASLRPYVVRDITGESRYTNHNLAQLLNSKPLPVMLRTITAKGVVREKECNEVPRRWQRAMMA